MFAILSSRELIPSIASPDAIAAFDIIMPPEVVAPPPEPEQPKPIRSPDKDAPAPSAAPAVKSPIHDRPANAAPPTIDITPTITVPAPLPPLIANDGHGFSGTASGVGDDGGSGGAGVGGSGTGGNGAGGEKKPPKYLKADWIRKPTSAEWRAIWPKAAFKEKRKGRVILSCVVQSDGQTNPCNVLHESPGGVGYGGAALALSQKFRVKPVTKDGEMLDTPVWIPLDFVPR